MTRSTLSLDPGPLLERACRTVGFDDFGDDTLPARVADLADQLRVRLDAEGAACAAAVIHGLLVERLRVLETRLRLPVADERIERPIIAFGEARSGTTLLQMLLACDPASRVLEFWEVMRPSPPPAIADATERRRRGDDDWREILEQIPKWLVSHPYNGMLGRNPPECERLWAFDFRSLPPSAWWRVPAAQWPPFRLPRDDVRQYEIHRLMLQHLQYGTPARRWVLKGTSHQHRLPALLDAYPDAVFVWIHRDPVAAIASRVELTTQVYEGVARRPIDRAGFAAATVETSVANFAAAAENPLASDPRIHHVVYQDFTAGPRAVIREVYDRVGLDFTESFDRGMGEWMAQNPSNRYGRFEYSADALGVDLHVLDQRVEPYRERFGVPREPNERTV